MSGDDEYFHIGCYLGALDINLLKLRVNVHGKLKIIRFLKVLWRPPVILTAAQLLIINFSS